MAQGHSFTLLQEHWAKDILIAIRSYVSTSVKNKPWSDDCCYSKTISIYLEQSK